MNDRSSSSEMEVPPPAREKGRTYASLLSSMRDRFRLGGIPDWAASAEWLAMNALEVTRTQLFSQGQRAATFQQSELLEEWTSRRLAREPVQYILGQADFCGLKLAVDPRVLIPRPETELLVERIVDTLAGSRHAPRILDVGTGSGCIALALASRIRGAEVTGTDYSDEVLDVARTNGQVLELAVDWVQWDVLQAPAPPSVGSFSVIVSNPPYIPNAEMREVMPEVVDYEPHRALFVEGDPLLFYRAILANAGDRLLPGGSLFFEVNPDFAQEIRDVMQGQFGFSETAIERDLAGRDRIVWGRRDG